MRSSRGVRFARALALLTAMSARVHGCYPPGYDGECRCPANPDAGDGATATSRSGRCTPVEADAGCVHGYQPAGPLAPPELADA
ncbi:MAG: hypothetical protein JNK05_15035 [Myxococcales bacterium]|nr:hypothetical protein [Myxococcales bacterium]